MSAGNRKRVHFEQKLDQLGRISGLAERANLRNAKTCSKSANSCEKQQVRYSP